MNVLLLNPTDVLFFRDGRPMLGSLAGHGCAWPLPNVIGNAFHAALHRAGIENVSRHFHDEASGERERKFGSLVTAGPFPVRTDGGKLTWYFPRPLDADWSLGDSSPSVVSEPALFAAGSSSLPRILRYPVFFRGDGTKGPSQEQAGWWSAEAWAAYLGNAHPKPGSRFLARDADLMDTEHTYGIAINPETDSTRDGWFYSASYLRLRTDWGMGVLASSPDRRQGDLIPALLKGGRILVGGQQRVCSVVSAQTERLPLPSGRTSGFAKSSEGKYLVKWVLLTPSIWPEISATKKSGGPQNAHAGGWLPNWIADRDQRFEGGDVIAGSVLLLDGPGHEKAKRKRLQPGRPIHARLVAALVPKPLPVTGWALPDKFERPEGGHKSMHLAVPAGTVYYFEAESESDASALATALNWHGDALGGAVVNRRSTLLGEKGFGLGICGSWSLQQAAQS